MQTTAEFTGPTWTARPYVAGTPDATLPSFGWTGGAGGSPVVAPEKCAAEATSYAVTLTWSIPDDLTGHLGFRIYQGVESLEDELADPDAVTFVVSGLESDSQYHFDVRSFDATTESEADACSVDVDTLP